MHPDPALVHLAVGRVGAAIVMADILLAHSFFLNNDLKQTQKMRPYPPLGTLYAAGALRSRGYSVALFDAMLADSENEFVALLDAHQPSIVAFYEDQFNFLNKMCLSHAREAACRMSRLVRARGAWVLAAGADASDHPEAYLAHGVHYVLRGEADQTLQELVRVLSGRQAAAQNTTDALDPIHTIPGLAFLPPDAASGVRYTRPRPPERQPDAFPFPAWDLVDAERYRAAWQKAHGYFSVNMVSTRGCPFHCNWCAKPIWGQRYAMRSPANVAEEMALVKRLLKPDHIWFADDIFGLRPAWVADFAREVEARNATLPFMIQSRVDLMTEQTVAGLARAGCTEVWLGAESGSQKILDAMDKGTQLPDIPIVRERLRQAGIKACFFIQFGYPGETWADIMATVQLVRDTLPDDIGVSVSYPLPGTKFYQMVQTQLDGKDHWAESNDLAMMFAGSYQTAFYKKLHDLLHQDLALRRQLQTTPTLSRSLLAALDRLSSSWFALGQLEAHSRSTSPTMIRKHYAPVAQPDLSKGWN